MTVQIKYKNNLLNKNTANLVYFVDDKFNISSLKKHVLSTEFSFISDLFKLLESNNSESKIFEATSFSLRNLDPDLIASKAFIG